MCPQNHSVHALWSAKKTLVTVTKSSLFVSKILRHPQTESQSLLKIEAITGRKLESVKESHQLARHV